MKILLKVLSLVITLVVIVFLASQILLRGGSAVDSAWGEEDYRLMGEKLEVEADDVEDFNIINFTDKKISVEETKDIDGYFTTKEIAAFITKANENQGPVTQVAISVTDQKKEVSFLLTESFLELVDKQEIVDRYKERIPAEAVDYFAKNLAGKLVYGSGDVTLVSSNEISLTLDDMRIGMLKVPGSALVEVEKELESIINSIITTENGFFIEELMFEDGQLYYRGSVPAKIEVLGN